MNFYSPKIGANGFDAMRMTQNHDGGVKAAEERKVRVPLRYPARKLGAFDTMGRAIVDKRTTNSVTKSFVYGYTVLTGQSNPLPTRAGT